MILAIDVGTTTIKAGLFSEEGRLLRKSFFENEIDCNGVHCECNPVQWIFGLRTALSSLDNLEEVEAIAVSGNGPTIVPVFSDPYLAGEELQVDTGNARLWLDRRADEEADIVSETLGAYVDPSFFLPKALNIARKYQQVYENTKHFLFSNDFIDYILTGRAKIAFPSEGLKRWYWNNSLLESLRLDIGKFPEFMRPGECVGSIQRAAAHYFGLPHGAPVFTGGPDFLASILGTGATTPGRVCNRSGTSEGINLCSRRHEPDERLMCYEHPVEPYYNVSGIISTSGKAIEWAKGLFGLHGQCFTELYANVAESPPGAGNLIFLPYLAGERAPIWDPDAHGVFNGLSLDTSQNDMLRAVVEGVCFSIRDVIRVMEELGHEVDDLRITGGPAQSDFLNQLKADITGKSVVIPTVKEAELVGDAVIAMTGAGKYGSFAEAAEEIVVAEKRYYPEKDKKELYDELFTVFRNTYNSLADEFKTMSRIKE
jgi:xylulokinase